MKQNIDYRISVKNLLNVCFVIICLVKNNVECFGPKLTKFDPKLCKNDSYFMNELRPEIQSKASKVNEIINLILNSTEKNVTYDELANFVDTFGSRLAGSEALEYSIDYLVERLQNETHLNVYTEEVLVPNWERGLESSEMVEPRKQKLSILGLGGTVSTPDDGTTAELLVFDTFEEFIENKDLVENKIVLFNINVINGSFVSFKFEATQQVAEAGGLAVIFKSFSTLSLYLPKAGIIRYNSEKNKIPAVSITIEDSDMLSRIANRGDKIVINLNISSKFHGMTESRNLIAELEGTEYPEEVVIVSGHLDSWDVGQGALDDGGGAFISWRALYLLDKLGFKPKRTLRAILFTGEEEGNYGSKSYVKRHEHQLQNISIILDSDFGTFKPLGLSFTETNTTSQCIAYETLQLLQSINANQLVIGRGIDLTQTDAIEFITKGVPASGLLNSNDRYFYYHHSSADTMNVMDSYFLDLCTALWTSVAFVFADLSIKLPRIENE